MTVPALPCRSNPVSSQFQIRAGQFLRPFSIRNDNASNSVNHASTASLDILALYFSRGRALQSFTLGLRSMKLRNHLFPGLLSLNGAVLPSLSRNFPTALSKASLDKPKPRFANSICQLVFFIFG